LAAIAAAGATVVAAVGGIWGTARQARRAREAATEDLKKSLAAAQENLRLNITAENERVRVAEENRSYDAAEQRITELYSKAVEQLGHEKAPVRLGGFYALERLAQDNAEHRQTVVDVVCAYLRMPFNFDLYSEGASVYSGDYQELQVRLAAQSLLARHLELPMEPSSEEGIAFSQPSTPPSSYWSNLKLDLTGALLVNADFTLCVLENACFTNAHFKGETKFWRTRFELIVNFDGAKFYGVAGFRRAVFNTEGSFDKAEFFHAADFELVFFGMHGSFDGGKFKGDAIFNKSEFDMGRSSVIRNLMELLSSLTYSSAGQTTLMGRSSREASRSSRDLRFAN
jgi:uncharacterized protein YjbI with pentapeptide repeats